MVLQLVLLLSVLLRLLMLAMMKDCVSKHLYPITKDGLARWSKQESYVIEAKRRGLSCGVARSALHSAFNKLSKDKRKAIQSKLAEDALQAA